MNSPGAIGAGESAIFPVTAHGQKNVPGVLGSITPTPALTALIHHLLVQRQPPGSQRHLHKDLICLQQTPRGGGALAAMSLV